MERVRVRLVTKIDKETTQRQSRKTASKNATPVTRVNYNGSTRQNSTLVEQRGSKSITERNAGDISGFIAVPINTIPDIPTFPEKKKKHCSTPLSSSIFPVDSPIRGTRMIFVPFACPWLAGRPRPWSAHLINSRYGLMA